ncbi:LysR family transcriptional regulator [Gottfriedia acidiceleris]|uniref:LysR family transcriptional regulator n=1 Tax=Gottfriedia acidiceleris TaxID=371036 RepID=UPI002FFFAAD1
MYIEKLYYIVEVAKERSILKAAENLHITSSVISQSISQLEKEWGVTLFIRTRTGSILTEEGKVILKKILDTLSMYQELKDEINTQKKIKEANLKITYSAVATDLIFNSLCKYKNDFPHVDTVVQEKASLEVLLNIKLGKADIGVLALSERLLKEESDIRYEKLCESNLCVFVSKNSSLVNYDCLTPQDLINENFVIYSSTTYLSFYNRYFSKSKIYYSANNMDLIKRAVKENKAITLACEIGTKYDPYVLNGDIVPIRLKTIENSIIPFWVIYSWDNPISNFGSEFLKYLKLGYNGELLG